MFRFVTEDKDLGIGHYKLISPPDEAMRAHSRNSYSGIVAKATRRYRV